MCIIASLRLSFLLIIHRVHLISELSYSHGHTYTQEKLPIIVLDWLVAGLGEKYILDIPSSASCHLHFQYSI